MGVLHFIEIDLGVRLDKLRFRLLERNVILDRALVKLLLDASLADGLVGDIIELRDDQVIDLLVGVRTHDPVHLRSLRLELQERFHECRSDIFIFDLAHHGLILIDVLVDLLDFFVDCLALIAVLLLQFLDEVEHALLIELNFGAEQELWRGVMHRLKLKRNVVFHAIHNQLEDELIRQQILLNHCLMSQADVKGDIFLLFLFLFLFLFLLHALEL